MKKLPYILCILSLLLALPVIARLVYMPDYPQMVEKADLIVIATPVARKELKTREAIPGVRRGNDPILGVIINTTFTVKAVLKGTLPDKKKTVVFYHYREADPPEVQINGLSLIDFTPNDRSQYLMFLKRRSDGTYEAMNGQTDPVCCIEKLKQKIRGR